ITRGFARHDQNSHGFGKGIERYGIRGVEGRQTSVPLPRLSKLSPTAPFFMASCKCRNGLQNLMRHLHCSRTILTRYNWLFPTADGMKKRRELELQRFFLSTLELLHFDGRPFTGLGIASANHRLPGLEIDRYIVVPLEQA